MESGQKERVLGLLVELGSRLEETGGEFNWTVAHWVGFHNDLKVAKGLLEKGLNSLAIDNQGLFPMDIAGL